MHKQKKSIRKLQILLFCCQQVEAKMAELKQQYDEKLAQKDELRRKAEHTEMMLDRASKLVSGLAGERTRWEQTVEVFSNSGNINIS